MVHCLEKIIEMNKPGKKCPQRDITYGAPNLRYNNSPHYSARNSSEIIPAIHLWPATYTNGKHNYEEYLRANRL